MKTKKHYYGQDGVFSFLKGQPLNLEIPPDIKGYKRARKNVLKLIDFLEHHPLNLKNITRDKTAVFK